MKKLLLTLIVIAGIMGCDEPLRVTQQSLPPRLTFSDDYNDSMNTAVYIITDNSNQQEYLCIIRPEGAAICLMAQPELKAEKEKQ